MIEPPTPAAEGALAALRTTRMRLSAAIVAVAVAIGMVPVFSSSVSVLVIASALMVSVSPGDHAEAWTTSGLVAGAVHLLVAAGDRPVYALVCAGALFAAAELGQLAAHVRHGPDDGSGARVHADRAAIALTMGLGVLALAAATTMVEVPTVVAAVALGGAAAAVLIGVVVRNASQ